MKKFKLNGFEVSSRITLSIICFLAALMHLTYLILFANFRMFHLMIFNIASVCFYIISGLITKKNEVNKHTMWWIVAFLSEVSLHAVLCTLIMGVDTYFILFPIIALPICVFYLFYYCDRKTFTKMLVIFVAATYLLTAVTIVLSEIFGDSIPFAVSFLSRREKTIIRNVNLFFSTSVLFVFTMMFYLEMSRMLDKLRDSTDKLQYTATHDALTGLTNRRNFWDYFGALFKNGEHYSIAMGDLDSFKNINDTYGHGCGDLVLRAVADIINESTAGNEIACRWGGEEMVVVFLGSRSAALERLETIRSRIESLALSYEGLVVHVTMTFGFADSDETARAVAESHIEKSKDGETVSKNYEVESLISLVDKRLYVGKNSGKNVIINS